MKLIPLASPHGLDMAGEKQKTQGPLQGFDLNSWKLKLPFTEILKITEEHGFFFFSLSFFFFFVCLFFEEWWLSTLCVGYVKSEMSEYRLV